MKSSENSGINLVSTSPTKRTLNQEHGKYDIRKWTDLYSTRCYDTQRLEKYRDFSTPKVAQP